MTSAWKHPRFLGHDLKESHPGGCRPSLYYRYDWQITILLQHGGIQDVLVTTHHLTPPTQTITELSVTTPTIVLIQNWEHPEHMHTAFHVLMVLIANQKSKSNNTAGSIFSLSGPLTSVFSLSTYSEDQSISLRCQHQACQLHTTGSSLLHTLTSNNFRLHIFEVSDSFYSLGSFLHNWFNPCRHLLRLVSLTY